MNQHHKGLLAAAGIAAALLIAGCASLPAPDELDRQALAMIKASFREQGIARLDRLDQDLGQKACSSDKAPADAVARQIETESMATVRWPAGGQYIGDWREGEKLAQSGRGMTWTDGSAATSANGGQCYNCHQIGPQELSFGTIGPSLYNYGKLRGVTDPASANARPIVEYTWGKIWNAKAYNACSNMPRVGHTGILSEAQVRHVVGLLLDPKSPVNQ